MQDLPLRLRWYVSSVIAVGVIYLSYMLAHFDWKNLSVIGFILFLILLVISDSLPVQMPRGGVVTVSFAIYYASIIVYGAQFTMLIALLGDLFCSKRQRGGLPWYKDLFNKAQLTLSVGLAGSIYEYFHPVLKNMDSNMILALSSSLLFFLLLNTSLVAVVVALAEGMNPWQIILINMKWALPNYIALAPLGLLIALIYTELGFLGVALFMIPLLVARSSFQAYVDVRATFLDTIQSLAAAIDAKDPYTKGHSERVAGITVKLARAMKLSETKIEQLQYMAMLHDMGKLGIREAILNKPSKLTMEEFAEMKKHSTIGAEIVQNVKYFKNDINIIRHHHERWDGQGYPAGLRGEAIPLGARIIAVADAYDAMITDRPYRKALTPREALEEIKNNAASQLDPKIVQYFCKIFPALLEEAELKDTSAEADETGGQKDVDGSAVSRDHSGMVS